MGSKIASKMVFVIFIFFSFLTLVTIVFSITNVTDPDYQVETYVTESGTRVTVTHGSSVPMSLLFACNSTSIIITIMLLFYWLHRRRYDKLVDDLPSYIKMYRRVKLEKIAQRMNISMKELDNLLQTCVKKGTVKGYFDHSTGEFVAEGTQYQTMPGNRKCPNCGATLDNTFLEGEEIRCSYCNMVMVQRSES